MSPLSHLISLKSTKVVSILIDAPLLCILQTSEGSTRETSGTEKLQTFVNYYDCYKLIANVYAFMGNSNMKEYAKIYNISKK